MTLLYLSLSLFAASSSPDISIRHPCPNTSTLCLTSNFLKFFLCTAPLSTEVSSGQQTLQVSLRLRTRSITMAINDLPNELLFIVVGFLSQRDLNSLLQTSRPFHTALNTTLYSNNIRRHHSSALWWAATKGPCGTIRHMITCGADLTIRNEDANVANTCLRALKKCVSKSKKRRIKTRQAQPRRNLPTCGETLLHRAAMSNQLAVVKLLLDLGVNMLSVDTNGYYPVQHAAHRGHEAVVKLFLDKGYAPNEMSWDAYEPSALHSAVYGGHSDVARLLLDHGADPSLRGPPSQPYPDSPAPLDVALLKIGTKLPWHRRKYSHPTGEGIPRGREKCALLLIERGARLTTSDGASPYLVLAVQGNFMEVVQVLLALGLDPNDDFCGQTALDLANKHKYPELIELLGPLTSPVAKGKRKRRKNKS